MSQPDIFAMLDELAAHTEPGAAITRIVEQPNGHIVVWTDAPSRRGGSGREYVALLDMGPVLNLYSGQGVDINPAQARELAAALTRWADRTEEPR